LQLSIGVLSTMFVGSWAMMGGSKKKAEQGPALNASSKDEEKFIQYVISNINLPGEGSIFRIRILEWATMANRWLCRQFLKEAEGNSGKREGMADKRESPAV